MSVAVGLACHIEKSARMDPTLNCTALHCFALHCTALYRSALSCSVQHSTALCCISLQYSVCYNALHRRPPALPLYHEAPELTSKSQPTPQVFHHNCHLLESGYFTMVLELSTRLFRHVLDRAALSGLFHHDFGSKYTANDISP